MAQGRHVELSPFSIVPALFSAAPRPINDTLDYFWHDSDLMPMFVQENYIYATPAVPPDRIMINMANAAEAISVGELATAQIMRQQDWVR